MKILKYLSCLAVLVAVLAVALAVHSASAAADARILSKGELSSFVGAACCKSKTSSNANCMTCQGPNSDGKYYKCNGGNTYTRRTCVSGEPDGCEMKKSGLLCSGSSDTYPNENCDGMSKRDENDCYQEAASGDECTKTE